MQFELTDRLEPGRNDGRGHGRAPRVSLVHLSPSSLARNLRFGRTSGATPPRALAFSPSDLPANGAPCFSSLDPRFLSPAPVFNHERTHNRLVKSTTSTDAPIILRCNLPTLQSQDPQTGFGTFDFFSELLSRLGNFRVHPSPRFTPVACEAVPPASSFSPAGCINPHIMNTGPFADPVTSIFFGSFTPFRPRPV